MNRPKRRSERFCLMNGNANWDYQRRMRYFGRMVVDNRDLCLHFRMELSTLRKKLSTRRMETKREEDAKKSNVFGKVFVCVCTYSSACVDVGESERERERESNESLDTLYSTIERSTSQRSKVLCLFLNPSTLFIGIPFGPRPLCLYVLSIHIYMYIYERDDPKRRHSLPTK